MAKIISVSASENLKDQTLLSLHLATFLAALHKTCIVDFLPQTHLAEKFVAQRHFFNLKHNQNLPVPAYFENTKNLLSKIGADFDFVVLDDASGSLLEYADIVLTLVDGEKTAQMLADKDSPLLRKIWLSKIERAKKGKSAFKHILIPFDSLDSKQIEKLQQKASFLGYALAPFWRQNEAYYACLNDGITVLDKDMPYFEKNFNENDFFARRNLKQILEFIWADK